MPLKNGGTNHYSCLLYSPFLNLIEECWSKIKSGIRRNPLKKDDELTPHIAETCNTVATKKMFSMGKAR
jgi:hypothetical protein